MIPFRCCHGTYIVCRDLGAYQLVASCLSHWCLLWKGREPACLAPQFLDGTQTRKIHNYLWTLNECQATYTLGFLVWLQYIREDLI